MPESDDASRSESRHEHGINLLPRSSTWERVGRAVLAGEFDERRYAVEASFRDLGRAVATGSEVSIDYAPRGAVDRELGCVED